MDEEKLYKFYDKLGSVYVDSFLLPQWDNNSNPLKNKELYIFLKNYAYERQGGNALWPHIVAKLMYENNERDINEKKFVTDFKTEIKEYKKYEGKKSSGYNEKRNPIFTQSILQFSNKLLWDKCFTSDKQKWKVQKAYDDIRKINGIGDKIASFYLRDLKEYHLKKDKKEVEIENEEEQRKLLQPIDIWVRRIVEETKKERIKFKNDKELAKYIVSVSLKNKLNPERVNMGMWFFGSQVIEYPYKLYDLYRNCRNTDSDFDRKLKEYVEGYKDRISIQHESLNGLKF